MIGIAIYSKHENILLRFQFFYKRISKKLILKKAEENFPLAPLNSFQASYKTIKPNTKKSSCCNSKTITIFTEEEVKHKEVPTLSLCLKCLKFKKL